MQEIWRMLAYSKCRFLLRLDNTYELFLCAVLDIEQNPVTLAGTIKLTPWNIRTNVGDLIIEVKKLLLQFQIFLARVNIDAVLDME